VRSVCFQPEQWRRELTSCVEYRHGKPHTDWEAGLAEDRKSVVVDAIGSWSFSAHDFSDDELVYAALIMLDHALQMPELEQWRLNAGWFYLPLMALGTANTTLDELFIYLQACRVSYNDFVHYHNFRHVVDVLQAVFYFLVQLRILPQYPKELPSSSLPSPLASILQPFDALVLLVSALGHDVGHPGVNNAFLVSLNAPLAQLYNDRSVLESFHCAAYSQILRRHWPSVFQDTKMRRLMINSVLATDMGLHFKYMSDLRNLQEVLSTGGSVVEKWEDKHEKNTAIFCVAC